MTQAASCLGCTWMGDRSRTSVADAIPMHSRALKRDVWTTFRVLAKVATRQLPNANHKGFPLPVHRSWWPRCHGHPSSPLLFKTECCIYTYIYVHAFPNPHVSTLQMQTACFYTTISSTRCLIPWVETISIHCFIVWLLLGVTNIRLGEIPVNTTKIVLQSINIS